MLPTYLEHLTDSELLARLAKLEAMGKATAARLASGDRGEQSGSYVSRGHHVPAYSNESALNRQREAYRQTREEFRRRAERAA